MKKQLTIREARKRKQRNNTIYGIIGGITTAAVLMTGFVLSQGDNLQTPDEAIGKTYTSNSDSEVEYVKSDGSDTTKTGFTLKGKVGLADDLPKLQKTPRMAWDSIYYNAVNKGGDTKVASQNNSYLWDIEGSTKITSTYQTTSTQPVRCTIIYVNEKLEGKFSSDKEATEFYAEIAGKEYTTPATLWTSYNLREYYEVSFLETEKTAFNHTFTRASINNKVVLSAEISCRKKTTSEEVAKASADAINTMIAIVPIEVK